MNVDPMPVEHPHRPSEHNREAPSALVNACQSQGRWLYLLSFFIFTLAGSAAWCIYQMGLYHRVLEGAYGMEPTWMPQFIDIFAVVCGSLALLNFVVVFRAGSAMRGLAGTRRVTALHRALCRLRLAWAVMAFSLVVVVAGLLVWRFSEKFPVPI